MQLAAEEDVGDDVEVLAEREILEHRRDAERQRRAGIGQRDRLAAERHGAGARLMHAGQDLDERRFARAVVADERDDLAGMNVEIDVGQRRDRAEMLGDAAQAEHQLAAPAYWCLDACPSCTSLPFASPVGRARSVRPSMERPDRSDLRA